MSLIYRSEATSSRARRHGIYLGGKSDAKDLAFLQSNGITHILNVTPQKEAGVQVSQETTLDLKCAVSEPTPSNKLSFYKIFTHAFTLLVREVV